MNHYKILCHATLEWPAPEYSTSTAPTASVQQRRISPSPAPPMLRSRVTCHVSRVTCPVPPSALVRSALGGVMSDVQRSERRLRFVKF